MSKSSLYLPLDVNYAYDDGILEAGEQAEILFIRSLCLCKKVMSDGFLSDRQIHSMGLRNVTRRASALCAARLFERDSDLGGYWVRSWLKHNRSAEEVREIQEKRRSAGMQGGRPKTKLVSHGETKGKANAKPIDKTREDKTERREVTTKTAPPEVVAAFEDFWKTYPRRTNGCGSKKNALAVWLKLSKAKRAEAVDGLPLYSRVVAGFPKDTERYLRYSLWEELEEPSNVTALPSLHDSDGFYRRAT